MTEHNIHIPRKTKSILTDRWVWQMAWRDARHNFSRLFLFVASLITGIAAVVALDSFNRLLQLDIDRNAKALIGADFVVNGDKKFSSELQAVFDSTGFEQASQVDMASMVLFVNNGQSRLIRLVALSGGFPFYGELKTVPADAFNKTQQGRYAMLDESLASQYEVSDGDSIRLGNSFFQVSGVVTEIPGGGGIMATFTPSVYIATSALDATGLVQFGSRVNYRQFFKTNTNEDANALEKALEDKILQNGYSVDTVEKRKEGLGKSFQSIYSFFSLLAFLALILGCIGVASSVHIYAGEKRDEVAILRCVGSSGWQAFNIYFIQIFVLGILGSVIGSVIGLGIQFLLPLFLKGIIPFEVVQKISWISVVMGVFVGVVVSVLFSMLPLVAIRSIPPLNVLRSSATDRYIFSKARWAALVLIAFFPMAFASWQTRSIFTGAMFFAGLVVALLCLIGVASLLLYATRRFFPHGAGFIWRHSLSSLFRPNNQTRVLLVTIGLGAFIIATLNIIENSLLAQVEFTGQENQSNTILFDIQPHQRDAVVKLIEANGLPVNQVVPIVTCRISEVNGRSVYMLQEDTTDQIPNWALTREYRVTYRDSLHHSEELVKGELQRREAGSDSVWVTLSEGMEENLGITVGDSLVFDMQGVPLKVRIAGIRKVEWQKDPPNFIFVFPTDVLEAVPQIFVTATRVEEGAKSNTFQQQLVAQFPNVSLIDIRLILNTVNNLFNKLGLVVRFLALFSIITGLVVLAGAVMNSKFVRIRENVLLRTMGAQKKQLLLITLIEYAWLGLFSALTGVLLSMASGWLLTTFFFQITFSFAVLEMILIGVAIVFLTVVIGWYNSREVISTPPLQILRRE